MENQQIHIYTYTNTYAYMYTYTCTCILIESKQDSMLLIVLLGVAKLDLMTETFVLLCFEQKP